jgi:hypothetical protein
MGDRNVIEAIIISLPLAIICGSLVPASEEVKAAAERAAAKHTSSGPP